MRKSRASIKQYQEMIARVLSALRERFREVIRIEYPESYAKRAVDFVVEDRGVLKVYPSMPSKHSCIEDLRRIARILGLSAVVVTNRIEERETIDEVVHLRYGVKIVNEKTFSMYLRGVKVFVYEYRGSLYTHIDGRKLRELRLKHRLSLGELAGILGISRKALYQHEQGKMDMSIETAERLIEAFPEDAEEVFNSINLFSTEIVHEKGEAEAVPRTESEAKVISALTREGAEVAVLNYSPPDMIARVGENKLLIVSDNVRRFEERVKKLEAVERMSTAINALAIAVGRERELSKDFDQIQFVEPAKLRNMLHDLVRSSRA